MKTKWFSIPSIVAFWIFMILFGVAADVLFVVGIIYLIKLIIGS